MNQLWNVSIFNIEPRLGRSQIIASNPNGPGGGALEIQTSGMSVGNSPGVAGLYMMKVVHGTYGVDIQSQSNGSDWELWVNSVSSGLRLIRNGDVMGEFDAVVGTYIRYSDRRLKSDIKPLNCVLPNIMQLVPSNYKFTKGNPDQKTSIGFIAQDVEKLFPELVSVSSDERSPGIYSLNYSAFGVLAIKAIQEQQALIEKQRTRSAEQQKIIEDLKTRLDQLEALVKN